MIKLQFVCGSGLSSRLIAWYGNGYGGFSHVDAVLPDGSLIGARSDYITPIGSQDTIDPGVQVRPAAYETWVRRTVVEISCTKGVAAEWEKFLRSQINHQYDKDSIIGFITGHKDHQAGHWICSALQTDALEKIGKLPSLPVPPAQVTPNSLLLMVSAIGGQVSSFCDKTR